MFKKIAFVSALISIVALSGCATNAEVSQMTAHEYHVKKPVNLAFLHNINVEGISGFQETNPLWMSKINDANFKSALTESLSQAHLLGAEGSKYALTAKLIKLERPFFVIDLKVTCQVHYMIMNKKTKKLIYNDDVLSSYTATFNDAPLAITRLKVANEGAARTNIQKLIDNVYNLRD